MKFATAIVVLSVFTTVFSIRVPPVWSNQQLAQLSYNPSALYTTNPFYPVSALAPQQQYNAYPQPPNLQGTAYHPTNPNGWVPIVSQNKPQERQFHQNPVYTGEYHVNHSPQKLKIPVQNYHTQKPLFRPNQNYVLNVNKDNKKADEIQHQVQNGKILVQTFNDDQFFKNFNPLSYLPGSLDNLNEKQKQTVNTIKENQPVDNFREKEPVDNIKEKQPVTTTTLSEKQTIANQTVEERTPEEEMKTQDQKKTEGDSSEVLQEDKDEPSELKVKENEKAPITEHEKEPITEHEKEPITEHEKEPISEHETPREIPTKPIYPGKGKWAKPGKKYKPHVTPYKHTSADLEEDEEDKEKPEGYEVFDEQQKDYLKDQNEFDKNFEEIVKEHELDPYTDAEKSPQGFEDDEDKESDYEGGKQDLRDERQESEEEKDETPEFGDSQRDISQGYRETQSEFGDGHDEKKDSDRKSEYRDSKPEYRDSKSEYRNRKPEYRDSKSEYRDRKPEYRDSKSEYRDSKPEYQENKTPTKPVIQRENIKSDYDDSKQGIQSSSEEEDEERPSVVEEIAAKSGEFVPSRVYAQVRRSEDKKHLPTDPEEPRLREVIKDSKIQTVYTEEGYEDLGYDHAGHEKKAEKASGTKESRKKEKNIQKYHSDSEVDGTENHEILKTKRSNKMKNNKNNQAKLIKTEESKTTAIQDMGNGKMAAMEIVREVKSMIQPNNKTKTKNYVKITPKNVGIAVPLAAIKTDSRKRLVRRKRFTPEEDHKLPQQNTFVKPYAPPVQYTNPNDKDDKYPYYAASNLNKNSPLRYAQNLNHVPDKSQGKLTFYEQADRLECPEVPSNINPVPEERLKKAEKGEGPADTAELPESRLAGLGDKIDCLKVKYFGSNPLDSPLFKEEIIGTPEPLFKDLSNKKIEMEISASEPKPQVVEAENAINTETADGDEFDYYEDDYGLNDEDSKPSNADKKERHHKKRKKVSSRAKNDKDTDDDSKKKSKPKKELTSEDYIEDIQKAIAEDSESEEDEEKRKEAVLAYLYSDDSDEENDDDPELIQNDDELMEEDTHRQDDDSKFLIKDDPRNATDKKPEIEVVKEQHKKIGVIKNREQVVPDEEDEDDEEEAEEDTEGAQQQNDEEYDEAEENNNEKREAIAEERSDNIDEDDEEQKNEVKNNPEENEQEEEEEEEDENLVASAPEEINEEENNDDDDETEKEDIIEMYAPKDLEKTNLEESSLKEPNLKESNLRESNLEETNLEEPNVEKSNLEEPKLEEMGKPNNIYDQIKLLDLIYKYNNTDPLLYPTQPPQTNEVTTEQNRNPKALQNVAHSQQRNTFDPKSTREEDEMRFDQLRQKLQNENPEDSSDGVVKYQERKYVIHDDGSQSEEPNEDEPENERQEVLTTEQPEEMIYERIIDVEPEQVAPENTPDEENTQQQLPEEMSNNQQFRPEIYTQPLVEVPVQVPVQPIVRVQMQQPEQLPNSLQLRQKRPNVFPPPVRRYSPLQIFDVSRYIPRVYPNLDYIVAQPATILPKYKTISEVSYKDDIKPNEQLNVFTDVLKTIQSSEQNLQQASSNKEESMVTRRKKIPRRKSQLKNDETESVKNQQSVNRGKNKFQLHENHKYPEDFDAENGQNDEKIMQSPETIYKVKTKRQPSLSDTQIVKNLDYADEIVNEVIGLVPPPAVPKYTTRIRSPPLYQVVEEQQINNFYVIGMKPPTSKESPIIYSDYKMKRRANKPKRRRIVKRSAARPSYSQITRNKKPQSDETEEDDYVPHRPTNYHYDEQQDKIVYDGPKHYEEYKETETTKAPTTTEKIVRKQTPTRHVIMETAGTKNEPSYIDYVLKLKSDQNYKEILDPEPTKKPVTTTEKIMESTTRGPTNTPEFLGILAKLRSNSDYKVIEDKPKGKATTTTTTEAAAEEVEEILMDVQNAPGGQNFGNPDNDQYNMPDTTSKVKNYTPRTSIDTSKYKSIERVAPRHSLSSKYSENEMQPQKPIIGIEHESSDHIEVVAKHEDFHSSTSTEASIETTTKMQRRRNRGRSRLRFSDTITSTPLPEESQSESRLEEVPKKVIRHRLRTTTEKYLSEVEDDGPKKALYRRHQNFETRKIPSNHKSTFTPVDNKVIKNLNIAQNPVSDNAQSSAKETADIEIFGNFDQGRKHGGNYRKLEDQEAVRSEHLSKTNKTEEEERLTDVVLKPYMFYTDPKLPKYVNQLKEPNTPNNHEDIDIEEDVPIKNINRRHFHEEEEEEEDDHEELAEEEEEEEQKVTTKKPFFIKDPSKRFYYYAPV